jgi:hypothetical protein
VGKLLWLQVLSGPDSGYAHQAAAMLLQKHLSMQQSEKQPLAE